MTAGPTPLPPAVSQVMAEPILYHRAPAFIEIYARVLERLKVVFQTENEVLVFASSGTGAMESAVANLIAPGDPALVASCGKFGERWAELCDAYGAETNHLETEWGERSIRRASTSARGRGRGRRGRLHDPFRDLHRRRQRRPALTEVRTRTAPDRRGRGLRARRGSAAAGRVGRGRGGRGLPEGADGAARASASRSAPRRRSSVPPAARGRRYYFDWERTVRASGRTRRTARSRRRSPVRALDVALGLIEDGGPRAGLRAPRAPRPRRARGGEQALGLELFGRRGRQRQRRDRDRASGRRSTAARSRS